VRVLGGSGGPLHRDTHYRGSPDHFFGGQPNSLGGIFKAGLEPPFVRDPRTLEPSAEQVQIPEAQPPIPTFADGGHLRFNWPHSTAAWLWPASGLGKTAALILAFRPDL